MPYDEDTFQNTKDEAEENDHKMLQQKIRIGKQAFANMEELLKLETWKLENVCVNLIKAGLLAKRLNCIK